MELLEIISDEVFRIPINKGSVSITTTLRNKFNIYLYLISKLNSRDKFTKLIKDQITDYIFDGSIDISTSRGCPHRCRFCYNIDYHNRLWRARGINKVLQEVDWIISNLKNPLKKIIFTDDNFFVNKKRRDQCQSD